MKIEINLEDLKKAIENKDGVPVVMMTNQDKLDVINALLGKNQCFDDVNATDISGNSDQSILSLESTNSGAVLDAAKHISNFIKQNK